MMLVESVLLQTTLYWLIIVALLVVSAIMSSFEVAFFGLSASEAVIFYEESLFSGKIIRTFKKKPQILLATILISNNLANIAIVIVTSFLLHNLETNVGWPIWVTKVLELLVISSTLLMFGEILPKVFASQRPRVVLRWLSPILRGFVVILYPITWALVRGTRFLDKPIIKEQRNISEEQLRQAIELTSDDESPEEEKELLKGLVSYGRITVRSIQRARVDVVALSKNLTTEQAIAVIKENGYSRYPVYESSVDHIIGILYAKDLLPLLAEKKPNDSNWNELIRTAYFIPESKKINILLEEFKAKMLHIAIVVDEFGGTTGIITLEDILEEIFGELNDEFDDDEFLYSKIADNQFIFDAKMSLSDVCRVLDIDISVFEEEREENGSLGGLILELYGRFPQKGEIINYKNFVFEVDSVSDKAIQHIKTTLQKETSERNTENSGNAHS
ncbi:MAG: gliding motility-associated protein GldE [Bacteroidia bacterium]|nr:gliding motility-associated protein GldE [Bacteroidia bacterium]